MSVYDAASSRGNRNLWGTRNVLKARVAMSYLEQFNLGTKDVNGKFQLIAHHKFEIMLAKERLVRNQNEGL